MLVFKSITREKEEGVWRINDLEITTRREGIFYIVVNVRGVETEYDSEETKVIIKERQNLFTKAFNYIESYFAMLIALLIVTTASIGFPFYLIPISLLLLSVFLFYVYT